MASLVQLLFNLITRSKLAALLFGFCESVMNPENFYNARKLLGLSQSALAVELGWSVKQVSNLETGARSVQKQTELAMFYLLHVADCLDKYKDKH